MPPSPSAPTTLTRNTNLSSGGLRQVLPSPHASLRSTWVLTEEPDGALRVAFTASGWVEMAWHLYQWGDSVEVIAPAELRDMVRGHQRGDVGVLP